MRTPLLAAVVGFVLSTVPLAGVAAETAEAGRVALVIGNANYTGGIESLANPTNDAQDVAERLTANGWRVLLVKDADRREMIRKLADFKDVLKSTTKPTALFFYAGHAVQLDGKNYLLPINETFQDKTDVTESAFVVDRVVDALDEAKVLQSVIFLDSCRDNPFKSKTRSIGTSRGLAAVPAQEAAEEGSAVIFSTAPNDVASDGSGRNGLFTEVLLPYLDTDLELTAMFKKVRDDVRKKSGGAQTPSIVTSGLLTGLYLGKPNVAPAAVAPVRPAERSAADLTSHRQTLVDKLGLAEEAKALWGTVATSSWIGGGLGVLATVGGYVYGASLRTAYDAATPDTGIEKGTVKVAVALLDEGMSIEKVAELTGLALATVEALSKSR